MALDPANGEPQWRFDDGMITSLNHDSDAGGPFVGGERVARLGSDGAPVWMHDSGGLIAETPIENGVLYGLRDGEVFGLDAESGKQVFTYEPGWQFPRPLTVRGETVIVAAGRSARIGGVATSGTEVWTAEFDTNRISAIGVGGGRVAVSAGGAVYGRPIQG